MVYHSPWYRSLVYWRCGGMIPFPGVRALWCTFFYSCFSSIGTLLKLILRRQARFQGNELLMSKRHFRQSVIQLLCQSAPSQRVSLLANQYGAAKFSSNQTISLLSNQCDAANYQPTKSVNQYYATKSPTIRFVLHLSLRDNVRSIPLSPPPPLPPALPYHHHRRHHHHHHHHHHNPHPPPTTTTTSTTPADRIGRDVGSPGQNKEEVQHR